MPISRNTKTGGGTNVNSGQVWNADDINADMNTVFAKFDAGIVNADISASAAIDISKVSLTNAITTAMLQNDAVTADKLADNAVVNANVDAAAAIAYSKLNLATSIVNADISTSAAISHAKLEVSAYAPDSMLTNGFFDWWQRSPAASGVSVTNNTDTYLADRWAVEPHGANCTVTRATSGLHASSVGDVGIELTGAASMTSIELLQRVPSEVCKRFGANLANQNVTFLAKVRHSGSAGTITPTLIVRSTSNTGDDTTATKFAAANMTDRVTQAFSGITSGNESSLSHTFDLGAMTDSQNGIEVSLSFAAMDAATHEITVSDVMIIRGSATPAQIVRTDSEGDLVQCRRFYKKTFNYATAPAASAGYTGSLVGAGNDVNNNNCGIPWHHGMMMRSGGTLTTYNPNAAGTGAANAAGFGDTAALQSSSAGQENSYAYFNTGPAGTSKTAFHTHMTLEAEWYD